MTDVTTFKETTEQDLTIWFYFDNPTIPVTESSRLALEGFVDAALVKPHLRLVIAGFETLPLPGQEFSGPLPAVPHWVR